MHLVYWLSCLLFLISENSVLSQSYRDIHIPGTSASIQLVLIPSGEAEFGEGEESISASMSSYWMGVTEITYDQFQPFRDKSFDSDSAVYEQYDVDAVTRPTPQYIDFTYGMGGKGGYPAVSMTQQAALRYCKWLYDKTGVFFRLPTEAEWEYACTAGENPSDSIDDVAWYVANSAEKYHQTGQKSPNAFGLYDMQGNVMEYTADQFDEDWPANINPEQPGIIQSELKGKYFRAVRGGAYDDKADDCSCTSRVPASPRWQQRDPQIPKSIWWNPDSPFAGFRVVVPEGEFSHDEVISYFQRAIID